MPSSFGHGICYPDTRDFWMTETLKRPGLPDLKSQAATFSRFYVNSEADIKRITDAAGFDLSADRQMIPKRNATRLQRPRDGQSQTVPSRLFRLLLFIALSTSGLVDLAHAVSSLLPDNCHASELTRFIGRPVSRLQEMELPEARFIRDRYCVATADIRPSRLTVIYSRKTNRILRLRCEQARLERII